MAAAAKCIVDAALLRQQMSLAHPEAGESGALFRFHTNGTFTQGAVSTWSSLGLQQSSRTCHVRNAGSSGEICFQRMCQATVLRKRMRVGAVSSALEIALESEAGVSYELLRDRLAAGEWELADEETRRLIVELAGEGALKRKWVYFSEVQFIPVADLKTIDRLWRAYTGNKFGYSVQRRIWKSVGKSWTAFFRKVGWTRPLDEKNESYRSFPSEFMWDLSDPTPEGHLPLTNALRGTQLLEQILCHPAFDDTDDENEINLTSPSMKLF